MKPWMTLINKVDMGGHVSHSMGVMQWLALDQKVACGTEMRGDTYESEQ